MTLPERYTQLGKELMHAQRQIDQGGLPRPALEKIKEYRDELVEDRSKIWDKISRDD